MHFFFLGGGGGSFCFLKIENAGIPRELGLLSISKKRRRA